MNQITGLERKQNTLITSYLAERLGLHLAEHETVAAVLTLRNAMKRPDGTWEKLTREEAGRLVVKIRHRMDKAIFKSSGRRLDRRLPILSTFEGAQVGKRLHLNFAITVPSGRTSGQVCEAFERATRGLRWCDGMRFTAEKAWSAEDWIRYICKEHDSIMLGESYFAVPQTSSLPVASYVV